MSMCDANRELLRKENEHYKNFTIPIDSSKIILIAYVSSHHAQAFRSTLHTENDFLQILHVFLSILCCICARLLCDSGLGIRGHRLSNATVSGQLLPSCGSYSGIWANIQIGQDFIFMNAGKSVRRAPLTQRDLLSAN